MHSQPQWQRLVTEETDVCDEQQLDFKFIIVVTMVLKKVGLDAYTTLNYIFQAWAEYFELHLSGLS